MRKIESEKYGIEVPAKRKPNRKMKAIEAAYSYPDRGRGDA